MREDGQKRVLPIVGEAEQGEQESHLPPNVSLYQMFLCTSLFFIIYFPTISS